MSEPRIPVQVLNFMSTLPPEYLDKKVSELINECLVCTCDNKIPTVQCMHDNEIHTEQCAHPVKPNKKKKPHPTPCPPNAFILYQKSKQNSVIDKHSEISNNEVSKKISEMWHNES